MALDLYAPCPCGSGKKLKFCCADVAKELEDILSALDGEQRVAALDRINRALDKHPDNPALMSLKGSTLLELREFDPAEKAIAAFFEKHPQNPVALAQSAVIDASHSDIRQGVLKTQQALELADKNIPMPLYEAVATLANLLLSLGHYQSGRQHLLLQVGLEGGQESPAFKQLMQVRATDSIPLPLRTDFNLLPPPAEGEFTAAEIAQWNAAVTDARTAHWFRGVETFLKLATKHRHEPGLWHNVAVLYGWLADEPSAAKAWRQKAHCTGISDLDATEAEMYAQLLDTVQDGDLIEQVRVTIPVNDAPGLKEHLLSTKRLPSIPFDPEEFREDENDVPPSAAFQVLSKEPTTEEKDDLTYRDLPKVYGTMLLYGKQTDRDARVEFVAPRRDDFAARIASVREAVGAFGGEPTEEVEGNARRTQFLWAFDYQLPTWAKPAVAQKWVDAFRSDAVFQVWKTIPQSAFGGKAPQEAASDPATKHALAASTLDMEISVRESGAALDLNPLRAELNLPAFDGIKLADDVETVRALAYWKLGYLDVAPLGLEALDHAFTQAHSVRARYATQKLGEALLARVSDNVRQQESVYTMMAQSAPSSTDTLKYLSAARELTVRRGQSPAVYLLMEFPLRMQTGDVENAQRIFNDLRTKHINEPGVSAALTRLMMEMGLISPEQIAAARADAGARHNPVAPVPAAAAPSGLWSPGGPATAAPAEAPKSKLWLPGMD